LLAKEKNNHRILVADDDRLVLSMLSLGLTRAGYAVETVCNGQAAIEAIEKNLPDLVLLDYNMPGATGIEVARKIRCFTNLPILMLTAYDDIELVRQAATHEINGYFVKPFDSSQLIPSIELNIKQYSVKSQLAKSERIITDSRYFDRKASNNSNEHRHHRLIRNALDTDQIDLVFQPILDINSGRINYFEALLRLVNEDGDHVTPAVFLDTAERSGLVRELDYRVLQLVVTHLAANETSDIDLTISLNLSGVHFGNPELLNRIREFLREDVVNPERLVFEVTETAALQDLEQARIFILELKKLGCRFALDDFGTGYASFYYRRSLPVDYIKIDGAFVRELQKKVQDRLFIKAMVDVAQGLGIKSIAEYVNNQETLEILKFYGVDYAQGYFIGKPAALPSQVSLPKTIAGKKKKL